jgi:hypothetical protein
MVVENIDCMSGPAIGTGNSFAAFVRGSNRSVLFLGNTRRGRIRGRAFEATTRCLSTFQGTEIAECPCTLPATEGGGAKYAAP